MATDFSILVPLSSRPDRGRRDANWAWLERRWRQTFPDAELIVESPPVSDRLFNHPVAINAAARRASHDILVEADADVAFDPGWVRAAVELVSSGQAPWVLPRFYEQLTERASAKVLKFAPDALLPDNLWHSWRGDSCSWAGVIVMPRDGFEASGGFPEQFEKWGADDVCFGVAMDTLWGRHTRLEGTVRHLWHTVSGDTVHHDRTEIQDKVLDRYLAAVDDPDAMRAVVFS